MEKPKGLIFLDFDGVLNSDAYFARFPEAKGNGNLDSRGVEKLNRFIESTHCHVVISSTWREGRSVRELQKILCERGFKYPTRIIGKTAKLEDRHGDGAPRGVEIARFMRRFPESPFVIFDDDDDMDPVKHHLVQTDPRVGLSSSDIQKAKRILRRRRPRRV